MKRPNLANVLVGATHGSTAKDLLEFGQSPEPYLGGRLMSGGPTRKADCVRGGSKFICLPDVCEWIKPTTPLSVACGSD